MIRIIHVPLIIVWLCLHLPCPAFAWQGLVLDVHDGDTVTVAPGGDASTPLTIRLYGVDAPELEQPGGVAARSWLAGQLPAGAEVEVIPYGVDRYGRALGLLQCGPVGQRRTLNGNLVAAGHAWVEPRYCRAKFCKAWTRLQREAHASGLGLWSKPEPSPPWEWPTRHTSR